MHYLSSGLTASLILAILLVAGGPVAAEDDAGAKLGTKIANVSFKNADGKATALYDLTDKKAIVIIFLNFECPNSTGYAPILAEMAQRYGDKGVAFLGVCNSDDDAAALAVLAKDFKLGFPVYKDEKSAAVTALKAETTPEVFVIDHNFILRYRGRIDDAFSARLKKNARITSHDLTKALDELLAGQPVSTPLTKAVGCPIWTGKEVKKDGKVTYYRDVLPILQNALPEMPSARRSGAVLADDVQAGRQLGRRHQGLHPIAKMPPWKTAEGIAFHNERKLTDAEIATLAAWADGGTPEGDPKDAPKPKEFVDGWQLGKPDLVLTAPEDFVVGPGGTRHIPLLRAADRADEDKYIVAFEVQARQPAGRSSHVELHRYGGPSPSTGNDRPG